MMVFFYKIVIEREAVLCFLNRESYIAVKKKVILKLFANFVSNLFFQFFKVVWPFFGWFLAFICAYAFFELEILFTLRVHKLKFAICNAVVIPSLGNKGLN